MGKIDAFVLLGLTSLLWGAQLTMMKPWFSGFALYASKKSILAGIIWVLITSII
jgi:hypothetical protein